MKTQDEFIIKKLVFAKYLCQKAITELSIGTDLAASVAINLLQDSIEMAILALEDKYNLNEHEINFQKRINNIKKSIKPLQFPLERQVLGLNDARKNFKHKAQLQSAKNVSDLSSYAFEFINQVVEDFFGFKFSDISLSMLVDDGDIKKHLINAEKKLLEKDYKESITSSAKSFELGLIKLKKELNRTNFLEYSKEWGWSNSDLENTLERNIAEKINNSFEELYSLTTLSIFGTNLQKYARFKLVTPYVGVSMGGNIYVNYSGQFENDENKNFENAQFCLDFALDFNIKVQNNWLRGLRMNFELSNSKRIS